MSNPISQLSGKPADLLRPVSVRVAPRVQALQGPAAVTELSPASNMPPVAFDPAKSDSLDAAFPSLEVITRRILRGMQDAMDRAIEDAAREAIEAQRIQARADEIQQAQREADLENALATLSENTQRPSSKSRPIPGTGPAEGEAAPVEIELVGTPNATGDGVEFSRPGSRAQPADLGPAFRPASTLDREGAGEVLKEVTQAVRQAPRAEAERVHRPENLAYSALLLNG